MNSSVKTVLLIISILVIVIVAYGLKDIIIGKPADAKIPDINLKTTDNETLNQDSFNEKPSVLVIFGTWCGACQQEAPHIKSSYDKFKESVNFYAIAVNDNTQSISQFKKEHEWTFPIALDDGSTRDGFNISGVPTNILVDAQGNIVEKHVGVIFSDELNKKIEEKLL